jgi:hypothetical protein
LVQLIFLSNNFLSNLLSLQTTKNSH